MNEISKSTGLSVVQLQQLSSAFSGLGLEMDKFGDFNKDTCKRKANAVCNTCSLQTKLELLLN
ncbi:Uncharacterised protein [Escherichia coli]|nr:Uncharacterised protein [Escherichia coli]